MTIPRDFLSEILNPEFSESRTTSLRALKNDIIGHEHKKREWIERGIVPALADILASPLFGKNPTTVRTSRDGSCSTSSSMTDAAHREAVMIINSLAQGGPAYIAPIFAGDTLCSLLSILSMQTSTPALNLAVLQCLYTIADKLSLAYQYGQAQLRQISGLLYARENIESLLRIIEENSPSAITQSSIALAAKLIAKTCTEEAHKVILAETGVLDALATKLATFVVAQGYVLPGAENLLGNPGTLDALPPAAPPNAKLSPILRAISSIIEYSKSRAEHFLTSPAIITVFPNDLHIASSETKRGPWGTPMGFVSKQNSSNPIDSLLPHVPHQQPTGSSNFPPLGSSSAVDKFDRPGSIFGPPAPSEYCLEEPECAVVSWLIAIAREESGMERLLAIRLASILFRLGLTRKCRITAFGYLLVPLLVQMLEKKKDNPKGTEVIELEKVTSEMKVREEVPAVLGTMIMDSRDLQKHAADAGAIKKLAQILKESFNPIEDNEKPMWSPDPNARSIKAVQSEISLGPFGVSPSVLHKVRLREGVLKALSALSLFREDYRKSICDNGVVSFVIDSLKPYETESVEKNAESKSTAVEGNPIPTILAACAAARSLTRSVSVLRTNLIDAGVADPIFKLIRSRNVELQIAATSVICNLAMDFSPMKEAIISANIITTLCEHSRSDNMKLRLESIWALKHVAYNSTNDIKMKIIESLEPTWLKRVICEDPASSSMQEKAEGDLTVAATGNEMEITSPATEPTSIRNIVNDYDSRDQEPQAQDLRMTDAVMPAKTSLDAYLTSGVRRRKLALNGDLDHTKQMRRDDIQVQEQILDLVRNMICGNGAPEMIDYLLQEVPDLFDILTEKLRPKLLPGFTTRGSGVNQSNIPTEILSSVTYIMIHIAAGLPRHRQLLALHPSLLKLMVPLFQHENKQVRVNCVWVVINLTFADDDSDKGNCRQRAAKLRDLGTLEHLTKLEHDPESDVRERTKTALHLMMGLLSS